jgi:hypothetical protein
MSWSASSMKEVVIGFLVGALVALVVLALHIFIQALKREYYDVGVVAEPLKTLHPELYAALYRAKQHARRVEKPQTTIGTGLKDRIMTAYANMQPDFRYLRLERNLVKLCTGKFETAEARATLAQRCRKDLSFLEAPVGATVRHNFVVTLVRNLLVRAVVPQREGAVEPQTPEARSSVRLLLEVGISCYG